LVDVLVVVVLLALLAFAANVEFERYVARTRKTAVESTSETSR
jgi:Tfp pilus assembly protein PilE